MLIFVDKKESHCFNVLAICRKEQWFLCNFNFLDFTMKRNDFFILSKLSTKLTKQNLICQITHDEYRPRLDVDTAIDADGTVMGALISVDDNQLKLYLANFRSVKCATDDFEDDIHSGGIFQSSAYREALELVSSRTPGLNNLKFLVDSNGLPTIDAHFEIFMPRKITGKFCQYVGEALLDVFDKLDAAMPEIEELGGQLYDERKKSIAKKRRPYEA